MCGRKNSNLIYGGGWYKTSGLLFTFQCRVEVDREDGCQKPPRKWYISSSDHIVFFRFKKAVPYLFKKIAIIFEKFVSPNCTTFN